MTEKEQRLAEFCQQGGYDGVLLRRRSNIAWITDGADVHCNLGTALGTATVLWTPRARIVFTDEVDGPRLAAEEFGPDWEVRTRPWWEEPARPEGHFAADYPEDVLTDLRAPLTGREIERLRALGRDAAQVMRDLLLEIRPGWSELRVAGELTGRLRVQGIFAPVVLVGADERVALFRHPVPTGRTIARLVMVVLCAQRRGLFVALTRLVHFGPIPEDLRRRHAAVCQIDADLHAATVPGARWGDVLAAGIRAYADQGYPEEWRRHYQGGPLGYEPRDFWARPGEMRTVQPDQAVGWNPSITGTKSEDTTLSGGEVITAMPDWPRCAGRPDILVRPM